MDVTALYRIKLAILSGGIFLLIDLYTFLGLRAALRKSNRWLRWVVYRLHWAVTAGVVSAALWYCLADPMNFQSIRREWILGIAGIIYLSKLFAIVFLAADDVRRTYPWIARLFRRKKGETC